jgi:hypothetical protein
MALSASSSSLVGFTQWVLVYCRHVSAGVIRGNAIFFVVVGEVVHDNIEIATAQRTRRGR